MIARAMLACAVLAACGAKAAPPSGAAEPAAATEPAAAAEEPATEAVWDEDFDLPGDGGGGRGRETVAVLGLEVVGHGAGLDAEAVRFAGELTESLRMRARAGGGPYTLAPGSDKNLQEMKFVAQCESETVACMAKIGTGLAADRLVYGKVEKRAQGYVVTIKALNVGTKLIERTASDVLPFAEASGRGLQPWGKALFEKLNRGANQGSLIISANADTGTVYLDGQAIGSLYQGMMRIEQLEAGDYTLAIESPCFRRAERATAVEAGRATRLSAVLVKADCPADQ